MSTSTPRLIYVANGYTGELIARMRQSRAAAGPCWPDAQAKIA